MTNKPKRDPASPKDFFLHLLMMVTLYGSAISFTVVIFQLINIYLPDVVVNEFRPGREGGYYRDMRSGLSALIVMFPIYLGVMKMLRKIYADMPGKLNLLIRKWLIYFTLFITSIIIMIDLITVLNSFLNGELVLRFALKALTVLFVAGSIFWYYLVEVRKH